MIAGKKVIAIIPARGGSKGLPNKNIKPLLGKPLINWTIEVAQRSKYVDNLIVSTDSESIAEVALSANCRVPFIRPSELATDHTPSSEVVLHVLDFYEKKDQDYDILVLLEPTSPLREDSDIDFMLEKIVKNYDDFDAIISIGNVKEHPSIVKKINKNSVIPFYDDKSSTTRRQDFQPAFFPYGVAYVSKISTFKIEKTFYPKRTTYFIIKDYQNYEIDTIYDFLAVENILKYKLEKK